MMKIVERLVDDQNCVVDDNANEDNETEHGQDIHLLNRRATDPQEQVQNLHAKDTAGAGQRYGQHNDQRIDEVAEQ